MLNKVARIFLYVLHFLFHQKKNYFLAATASRNPLQTPIHSFLDRLVIKS